MTARRAAALLGWGLAAVVVAGWLALVEVFWLPLRVGGVLVPVSVPAAVVGNLLLVRGAHRWSGSRLVAVLPAVVWLAVVLAASSRRPEGDLVITGGGLTGVVNTGFLLAGVIAAAFAVGRVVGVSRPRSGSGSGGAR
jgi:hypothetical protein